MTWYEKNLSIKATCKTKTTTSPVRLADFDQKESKQPPFRTSKSQHMYKTSLANKERLHMSLICIYAHITLFDAIYILTPIITLHVSIFPVLAPAQTTGAVSGRCGGLLRSLWFGESDVGWWLARCVVFILAVTFFLSNSKSTFSASALCGRLAFSIRVEARFGRACATACKTNVAGTAVEVIGL